MIIGRCSLHGPVGASMDVANSLPGTHRGAREDGPGKTVNSEHAPPYLAGDQWQSGRRATSPTLRATSGLQHQIGTCWMPWMLNTAACNLTAHDAGRGVLPCGACGKPNCGALRSTGRWEQSGGELLDRPGQPCHAPYLMARTHVEGTKEVKVQRRNPNITAIGPAPVGRSRQTRNSCHTPLRGFT